MNKKMRELLARKSQTVSAMRAISDIAAAAGRDLSDDEVKQFDGLKAQLESTNAAIDREQMLVDAERSAGVIIPDDAHITTSNNRASDPRLGFANFGDYAKAVIRSSGPRATIDERLGINAAAPSTFGSEGVGADGGFLIPPEFSKEIFTLALTDGSLIPMTDNVETTSNSMIFPKDETTPWGTDGVRAYWQSEANAGTATKPKFGTSVMQLHKLMGLVPLTNEVASDAATLNSYLPPLVARSIQWKTNEAILQGDGAGRPQGIYKAAAAVTVTKDGSQLASTVSTTNILNRIARLPPGSFPNAYWHITPDALPALFGLTLGNYPIYLPTSSSNGGGLQLNPYGTLMGRPIIVSQHAAAFSSAGDIALLDMSYYRTLTQAGGIQTATSMHLYFDADATAFRATFRIDGQPKLAAAIAQAKGGNTLSPFVLLGAR